MNKLTLARGIQTGALGVLLAAAGCQDLEVENLVQPDRARALGNPSDVEAFIGAAFYPGLFDPLQGSDGGLSGLTISSFTYAAADMTATLAGGGTSTYMLDLFQPRRAINNNATICSTICEWGPRDYWGRITGAASVPYDGLQLIDQGMKITSGGVDVTARAEAFAKFIQGWSWGYAALIFDESHVIPESETLPSGLAEVQAFSIASLKPYKEATDAAVAALEEAVAIARANPSVVHFPVEDPAQPIPWFGSTAPVSNAQFIQLANTLAARLLVLSARDPAERAAVNWAKVLTLTAGGVTTGNDLNVLLTQTRDSQVLQRLQNNSATGTTNGRWNYLLIGLADQSGAYQNWVKSPLSNRTRFNIVTPDRRITGATPTSNGSYTAYRADNNGFLAERGTYLMSAYQWQRHKFRNNLSSAAAATGFNTGFLPMITADENNLLRAEALLRTGNAAGAAALINITRTRTHLGSQLPPVTAAGVPTVAGACVPRTDAGACGTLMTALRYERLIELAGQDGVRSYADSRGFGMLPDGSPASFPVPGNVLDLYGLPPYTLGGVGLPGGVTYAPAN